MLWKVRSAGRAAADNEFRLDDNFLGVRRFGGCRDALQERLSSNHAHGAQGLTDGGQSGILERGALDIVKTDDGDIFRHAAAGLAKSLNRADGGNIVKREKRGKRLTRSEKFLRDLIAQER